MSYSAVRKCCGWREQGRKKSRGVGEETQKTDGDRRGRGACGGFWPKAGVAHSEQVT